MAGFHFAPVAGFECPLTLDGHNDSARHRLKTAIEHHPDEIGPLRELCQLMFERFGPDEALGSLQRLAEMAPDGAVYHNLGSAYLAMERFSEAVDAFRHSLRLRPDAPETQKLLEAAMHQM